jgi:hypothetical protein
MEAAAKSANIKTPANLAQQATAMATATHRPPAERADGTGNAANGIKLEPDKRPQSFVFYSCSTSDFVQAMMTRKPTPAEPSIRFKFFWWLITAHEGQKGISPYTHT